MMRILFAGCLALGLLSTPVWAKNPIRALMVTGGCCHDYQNQKRILSEGIASRANVSFTVVHQGGNTTDTKIPLYNDPDWSEGFDVIVHHECFAGVTDPKWTERILKPHREGLPALVIHCAMHSYRDKTDEWFKFVGVTSHGHGAHYAYEVENLAPEDPIMTGFGEKWKTPQGELYLISKLWDSATPLAHAMSRDSKKNEVCIWKNQYGKGRVFGITIGHHNETMQSEKYLDVVARGLLWAVGKLDDDYLVPNKGTVLVEKPFAGMKKNQNVNTPEKVVGGNLKEAPENIAYGKPTKASHFQSERDPKYAVDGRIDTRWCSPDNGAGYWWQVDLGKAQSIAGCRIVWEHVSIYNYKLEGSADEKNWTMLWDQTVHTEKKQIHEKKFTQENIRYVRLTTTKMVNGFWGSFWEFEVYGPKTVKRVFPLPGASDPPGPVTAYNVLKKVQVPTGFAAAFYAGPPYVNYPACLAAAPNGDVFVGIDPNGSLGKDPKHIGRVVRCVDEDGDGSADTFNDFISSVASARGLFYDNGTMWVLHPPYLRVYHDDDLDGTADRERILVEGLGSPALQARGADHCCNGFRVGIDGWLYIAVGDFGAVAAKGTDGKTLQLHGGGVLRVRPDGTELELYVHGLRNIYDVAVDPFLNAFTRDNTNDGGGWDVRLSHIIGGEARYGYPSLFKNFKDERIPPLADYGGGSPCGSLFLDEPGLPKGFGHALYTCDWGRSIVYRHPLTSEGAGFKAGQEEFVKVSRPTDMDVDGTGRLYISSWDGGGFSYNKSDVGYVVSVTATHAKPVAFPDLAKSSSQELLKSLASLSHVKRLHTQREILRRGPKPELVKGLEALASAGSDEARVAAIFTLKQLLGAASHAFLGRLGGEHALRALTDRKTQLEKMPVEVLVQGTKEANPRVRLQAAVGLGRLGETRHANALIPLLTDVDHRVAHVATRSLINLGASEACLTALDEANSEAAPALARVLQELHTSENVAGLVSRSSTYADAPRQQAVLRALTRLYHREAEWKGSWWSTRPDTTGPYYKHEAWGESENIGHAIRTSMAQAKGETATYLQNQIKRNKINLKDLPWPGSAPVRDLTAESKHDAAMLAKALKAGTGSKGKNLVGALKPADVVAKVQGLKGDVEKGARLFKRQACFACHTTAAGQPLKGPHLVGISTRYNRRQLAESILAPNAIVSQGFATHWFKMKDKSDQAGFVVREAGDEVEIRNIAGITAILKKNRIAERGIHEVSSMPKGLVAALTVQDFAALLAYLESLK